MRETHGRLSEKDQRLSSLSESISERVLHVLRVARCRVMDVVHGSGSREHPCCESGADHSVPCCSDHRTRQNVH